CGTAGADDAGVLCSAVRDPADIEDLADAFELAARIGRYGAGAATAVAALFDAGDDFVGIKALRSQCGCEIDAAAQDVGVAGGILAADGLAAVEAGVASVAQDGDLGGGPGGARVQHRENGPELARVEHHAHVAPGKGNAVAAVDGAQVAGRVGVEVMPVRIGGDAGHAPHDQCG